MNIRWPSPLKSASHASSIVQVKAFPSIIQSTLWLQLFSIQCDRRSIGMEHRTISPISKLNCFSYKIFILLMRQKYYIFSYFFLLLSHSFLISFIKFINLEIYIFDSILAILYITSNHEIHCLKFASNK